MTERKFRVPDFNDPQDFDRFFTYGDLKLMGHIIKNAPVLKGYGEDVEAASGPVWERAHELVLEHPEQKVIEYVEKKSDT